MKKLIYLLLILNLSPLFSEGQSAYQEVREGNKLYESNLYDKAEEKYRESIRKDGELMESSFNLGNALYRQGKYEDAGRYFQQAADKANSKEEKARAYHNLGNSLVKEKKLEEGIKAYKRALINNPKDEESRYNLAYTQQLLQQQQQQEQENQEQQDQDQQEQEENQDQQDKEDQEQEEQEEEQEQQQDQQQEQEQEKQEQQQQQQQENQVSREDAERILEALNNKEKELQEKLKKKKVPTATLR